MRFLYYPNDAQYYIYLVALSSSHLHCKLQYLSSSSKIVPPNTVLRTRFLN